jgi:hypothetical protein
VTDESVDMVAFLSCDFFRATQARRPIDALSAAHHRRWFQLATVPLHAIRSQATKPNVVVPDASPSKQGMSAVESDVCSNRELVTAIAERHERALERMFIHPCPTP